MRITREQLREIIIEQIRQGGPEDLWAAEEGRPESDPSPFTDALEGTTQISSPELEAIEEQAAKSVSDAFGREMIKLFENDPEMFAGYSTEEEWQQQVTYAQQELDTGLSAAIAEVIEEIETSLHGGEYAMDLR
jgi:hypothetical protein